MIFGHRGIPSVKTENSLESFQAILDYDIKNVELDVHLTLDNKLVVIHDFNTLKMCKVDKEISQTTYKELQSLSIDDHQKIPLLSQVFDILSNKVFYDIEVKSRGGNRGTLVKELLKVISDYKLNNNCFISSFDPLLLKSFNKLNSGIETGLIYSKDKEVPLFLRTGLGILLTKVDIIKPHHSQLKGFLFWYYTKILKKECYTWTVNSQEVIDKISKTCCKGFCSDNPQNFIS